MAACLGPMSLDTLGLIELGLFAYVLALLVVVFAVLAFLSSMKDRKRAKNG
jgi:hypothetical protein